jgi:prepilin peptidase CpaA
VSHIRANKNNFGAVYVNLTDGPETIAIALLLPFLAAAVTTDMLSRSVPNVLVLLMVLCGVALQMASLTLGAVVWSLGGVLVGLVILLPFYALGGMGAGDVKLLAALGSFLGPWGTLVAGIGTLIAGAVLGLGVIGWRFLSSSPIRQALPRSPAADPLHVPYSLAIAVGALIAVIR